MGSLRNDMSLVNARGAILHIQRKANAHSILYARSARFHIAQSYSQQLTQWAYFSDTVSLIYRSRLIFTIHNGLR